MKNNLLIFLIVPLFSLGLFSCDEDDVIAEDLLYGGGEITNTEVEINVSLTRINGWYMLDGSQIYGLDVTIGNLNNEDIYSVSIGMDDIYPDADVLELSEDSDLIIDYLPANSSLKPDYHWYVDDTGGTIYIGNIYVVFNNYVTSGNIFSIDFNVNFNIPGKGDFVIKKTKTFTTINISSYVPV